MKELTDLLPCPFCGGPAELDTRQGYTYAHFGKARHGTAVAVYCTECAVQISVCREDVPDIAPEAVIEMWNRRAASPASPAMPEIDLAIIRWWPDGMAERMEHVWRDLVGFIPSYKLYDLQRMLAEFGITMKVYEGTASPPPAEQAAPSILPEIGEAVVWKITRAKKVYGIDLRESFGEFYAGTKAVADEYAAKGWTVTPLYTHPTPPAASPHVAAKAGIAIKEQA